MKLHSLLIILAFAGLTLGAWAYPNRPLPEPPWPERIQGFAYSPYQADQDPARGDLPSEAEIDRDLELLAGKVNAVRTYSALDVLGSVPRLAAAHGINVTVGTWIGPDRELNERELAAAIAIAREHRNVVRVLVGNEALLRGDLPPDELIAYLDRAREAIGQPVSTAEPWHIWLEHPELAEHVDFLAVHLLPYWEGLQVERAVDYVFERLAQLEAEFPGKPIVLTEVGWPSNGRTRGSAVASVGNQALFLRRFLARAEREGRIYYLMEAFDQPWKARDEGLAGAHWGVYDANRLRKFAFTAPIVRVPEWQTLAAISVAAGCLILALLYLNSQMLRNQGRTFLAVVTYTMATAAVWILYDYTRQYLTATSVIVGLVLVAGMLSVVLVLLAEAHEWAEAHWISGRRRLGVPQQADDSPLPKVSIHVPAHNEPPEMLIATLDALARLDYPDFEVLVIDNNTRDEAVWRPVEARCAELGPRFRFFHVAPLEGFKAGALNFALRHTAPDAEIVAVIDSDYVVEPGWLRDLVPAFADKWTGIVQAPQDYRDEQESLFKTMCYAEYRGFFHIGMVTRNERNAIIQHGTMTLVRRRLLDRLGGWAEWCITEDAELGLRIFEAGYQATYVPRSYGRGLMPDTFGDFKKQRFRWAYGAMQILKAHAGSLFGLGSTLTPGQRYHFVAGWLPWMADGFNLLFCLAALAWSAAMIVAPERFDPPLMAFSLLPLSLFVFKVAKLVHLYRRNIGVSYGRTMAAAIAGLGLTHTIGIAVLKGLLTNGEPFFRTPKKARAHALRQALSTAREETLMTLALWLAAWGVVHSPGLEGPDRVAWVVVLLIQSIPFASSLVMSIVSAFPGKRIAEDAARAASEAAVTVASTGALEPAAAAVRTFPGRWLVVPAVTTAVLYALGWTISRFVFAAPIGARGAATDLVLLTIVSVCCFALSRRLVPFVLLQALLISVLLIGNALKIAFYGGPIMPDDVHSLPALLMILEGWQLHLTVAVLVLPVLLLLGNLRLKPLALAGALGALAVLSAPLFLAPGLTVGMLDRWVGNIVWNQRANYLSRGAMLHLIQETARSMAEHDPVPTAGEVFAAIQATEPQLRTVAASPSATKRNIHLVVLESFWDASQLRGAGFSRDPLDENFRTLWRATGYSTALVPVFGGYTANTEFEILCGYPVSRDSVKFERRLTNTVPCLPAVLKKLGYRTVASHPNVPAFWNRNNAYYRIGFETFHSSHDFVLDDLNGEFLSDESLYRQVRARLDEGATRPSFNYVLTFFGHWQYPLNEKRPPIITSSSSVSEVVKYANTVYYKSREAVEHVTSILSGDPEAMIILVGDHLPFLGPNFAGYAESGVLNGTVAGFDETMLRTYVSTPLIVIDGSRGPLKLGALPAYRLPSLILQLLHFDVPTIWDFTRQPEGLRIRPLPGLTLVLDDDNEAYACRSETERAAEPCQIASRWLQDVTLLDTDIFVGRRYALTGLY